MIVDVDSSASRLLVREAGEQPEATLYSIDPAEAGMFRELLHSLMHASPFEAAYVTSSLPRDEKAVATVMNLMAEELEATPISFVPAEEALASYASQVASRIGVDRGTVVYLGDHLALVGRLQPGADTTWTRLEQRFTGTAASDMEIGSNAWAAGLLGYLRAPGGLEARGAGDADPLTLAFSTWLSYQAAIGEAAGAPLDEVVIWAGYAAGLTGASISQASGHYWCSVSTTPGAELALGLLNSSSAQAANKPESHSHSGAYVERVAWPDTGFIQTPVVPLEEIERGAHIEGPVRVLCPSGDVVVPPETVATLLDGIFICGPETWEKD